MASAKKCDRCRKYYDEVPKNKSIKGANVRGIKIITSGPYWELDLCGDCIDALYEFMGIKEE